MATDYGVRQGLLGKGYSNDDIGYDQNTGYVTLKGQNFLKPEMNVQGTTYTSQQNFDNAYNQFNKQQRANQLQSATDSYITRATQPPAANPYNDQYTKMISDIMARVNAPQQDVYSTPQYAAAQAQAGRSAHQGIRAAQEALGSSGFGRSTTLGQAANQAQNEANEYLQLQLVPQIQAQLANQRQAEINNMYNMLNPVYNQLTRQDTQNRNEQADLMSVIELLTNNNQNEFNNNIARRSDARAEAGITGYYMPDGARDIISNILGLKQKAESQGVTSDQMDNFKSQADAYRNQLYQMGIDPNMVGFENDYSQAVQNAANYRGIPTLQGLGQAFNQQMATDQFQYGKEQDAENRKFREEEAIRAAQQFADSQGLQWANLSQRDKEFLANEQFRKMEMDWQKDPSNPDNIYKAAQTNAVLNPEEKPKTYKENPDFQQDVAYLVSNPKTAMQTLRTNATDFINKYGLDGYKELISLAQK